MLNIFYSQVPPRTPRSAQQMQQTLQAPAKALASRELLLSSCAFQSMTWFQFVWNTAICHCTISQCPMDCVCSGGATLLSFKTHCARDSCLSILTTSQSVRLLDKKLIFQLVSACFSLHIDQALLLTHIWALDLQQAE